MQDIVHPKGKVYYSMGEVAEMFDVNPSLLRYWEKEFDVLKPHRNKKGNRLFTPQDVDNIKIIYHLLKEKKMKIEVARKHMKDNKTDADRDALIMEKLTSIRSMLQQIKQDMLHGAADDDEDEDLPEEIVEMCETAAAEKPVRHGKPEKSAKADDAGKKAQIAPNAVEMELTITDIMTEEAGTEKLSFKEQMLFEIASAESGSPSLDSMIDTFLSKNYGSEGEDEDAQTPEHDPFAPLFDTPTPESDQHTPATPEKPTPKVIEQTLF